jgi:hypothetical protein
MSQCKKVPLLLLGAVLSACGGGSSGLPAMLPSMTKGLPPPKSTVAPDALLTAGKVDLKTTVDAALADASRRTGRPATSLKVVSAEALIWPDGSLGCAEPGVMYTMAPVPGYRVLIRAGEEALDYRASDGGYLRLCPPGRGVSVTSEGSK